jgi:uncharacterized DUF497 family protein
MERRFEWDGQKARLNFQKHGVRYDEAAEAIEDPEAIILYDVGHSLVEDRFQLIGRSSQDILFVVFVERRRLRIVSARRADRRERWAYYETHKIR